MATELERPKKNADAAVQRALAELCQRMHRFDTLASLLLLGVVVAAYALTMGLLDLALRGADATLASTVRWVGFGLFLVAVAFVGGQIFLNWRRSVNPYYAARKLEETLPDAKNQLINWLDLHDEEMPAAFRTNLSKQAAEQLEESDPDHLFDRRRNTVLAAIFAVAMIGLLVLLVRGPGQFGAMMRRAFLPFQNTAWAARTQITMVRPEAGSIAVTPTQNVHLVARIEGHVPVINQPNAPTLHYRHQPDTAWLTLPLQEDADGNWGLRLVPDQIRTGLAYQIKAGDAATPEYQIDVRAQPLVTRWEVTYHYRPYIRKPPQTVRFPSEFALLPRIEAPQGTEVELTLRTNRKLRQAGVEVTTTGVKRDLATKILADDPQVFQSRFTLEKSGHFRVQFTSAEGEENADRATHPIEVAVDGAPQVALTKPGKDVSLPANGVLELEGLAEDDFGVKQLVLRLKLLDGAMLQAKPYRPDTSLQFEDGTYPNVVEYRDFLDLNMLRNDKDEPAKLAAGSIVEYWLEATDNSDFPTKTGNVGQSQKYKITLLAPIDAKQQQAEQKKAADRAKQHDKKQDTQRKQQSQQRKDDKEKADKGQSPPNPKEMDQLQKEKQYIEQKLNDAAKEQQKQQERGSAKGNEPDKSEAKSEGADKNESPGESKDQKPDAKNPPGNNKDQGKGEQAGSSKDGGAKEESKGTPPDKNPKQDNAKGEAKSSPKDKGGDTKGSDSAQGAPPAGSAKQEPKTGEGSSADPKTKEGSDATGAPQAQAKADPKSDGKTEPKQGDPLTPAQAKGEEKEAPLTQSKEGKAETAPPGQSKDSKAGPMTTKAEPKEGEPNGKEEPGTARGDEPKDGIAKKEKQRESTWEEIAKLADQLKEKKGSEEQAAKELGDIAKNAADPNKRDAARDALQKSGRNFDPKVPMNGADPNAKGNGPPESKDIPAKTGTGVPKSSKEPPPETKGNSQIGTDAKLGKGMGDELKETKANPDHRKEAGNLQLEDWKQKITPDLLKRAGLSDADWQRYVKNAQAYDDMVRRLNGSRIAKGKNPDARGEGSSFPGGAARVVGDLPSVSGDPLNSGQAQPPAELRDAVRRSASRPRTP